MQRLFAADWHLWNPLSGFSCHKETQIRVCMLRWSSTVCRQNARKWHNLILWGLRCTGFLLRQIQCGKRNQKNPKTYIHSCAYQTSKPQSLIFDDKHQHIVNLIFEYILSGLWAGIKPLVTMRSYAEKLNTVFEFIRMKWVATVWCCKQHE